MRLGLPDESKYDLDRLMYSPIDEKSEKKKFSKKIGTGKGKGSRRSMKLKVPTDRMEVGIYYTPSSFRRIWYILFSACQSFRLSVILSFHQHFKGFLV